MMTQPHPGIHCLHGHKQPGGLALVAIGNLVRRDDGVAAMLCQLLPEELLARLCYFDLGPYTSLIAGCLSSHHNGVLVDSIISGAKPGSSVVIDLVSLIDSGGQMHCKLSHGLSLLDELSLASKVAVLPKQITLFGIEAADSGWGESLSQVVEDSMPYLVESLSRHIECQLSVPAIK